MNLNRPFKELKPGPLTFEAADELNRALELLQRLQEVNVQHPLEREWTPNSLELSVDVVHIFPAIIGAETTPNNYTFTEQLPMSSRGWDDKPNGVNGNATIHPAHELNGVTGIAAGTYVWMMKGFLHNGSMDQDYRFIHGPTSTKPFPVRIDSESANKDAAYAWTEMEELTNGTFGVKSGGRTGTLNADPANYVNPLYEVNDTTQIIPGTIVLAHEGFLNDSAVGREFEFWWEGHRVEDGGTNTTIKPLIVAHNSNGTPTADFGVAMGFQLESTTTVDTDAANLKARWDNATHASRKAEFAISVFDTAEREAISITTDGNASTTGVLEAFALKGDITPTALAANTDNWNPTGLSGASTIRMSASAIVDLTGLAGGSDGRVILLWNVGGETITLKHDATSTEANRFLLPGDVDKELAGNAGALIQYDATSSRWRVVDGTGSSTTSTSDCCCLWWVLLRMEETSGTFYDSSGNDEHFTEVNGPIARAAAGKVDEARQFVSASNNYGTRAYSDDWAVGVGPWMVAAWVYVDDVSTGDAVVASKAAGAGTTWKLLVNSSGDVEFTFGGKTATVAAAINDDTWYLLIGWYDDLTDTVNVTVDDGSAGTESGITHVDASGTIYIGYDGGVYQSSSGTSVFWLECEESGEPYADSVGSNDFEDGASGPTSTTGRTGNGLQFVDDALDFTVIHSTATVDMGDQSAGSGSDGFWLECDYNCSELASTAIGLVEITDATSGAINIHAYIYLGTAGDGNVNFNFGGTTVSVASSLSAWHHVLAWYDPVANTINIQLDGGSVVSDTNTGSDDFTTGAYILAGAIASGGNGNLILDNIKGGTGVPGVADPFQGRLDEVIFAKIAPPPSVRTAIFEATDADDIKDAINCYVDTTVRDDNNYPVLDFPQTQSPGDNPNAYVQISNADTTDPAVPTLKARSLTATDVGVSIQAQGAGIIDFSASIVDINVGISPAILKHRRGTSLP